MDFATAAIDLKVGLWTRRWQELVRLLFGDVAAVSSLPAVINRGTLAELNALGLVADDAGYLAFETTFGHLLRWTGSAWEFAPGEPGNGYIEGFAVNPQATGWQLCDGSATTYLGIGATLAAQNFTTPDLSGSPGYLKMGAAYAGIAAAVAPGATAVMSGSTGSEAPLTSETQSGDIVEVADGTDHVVLREELFFQHHHTVLAHSHDEGTLAAAVTVDATGEPRRVTVLPYFRR